MIWTYLVLILISGFTIAIYLLIDYPDNVVKTKTIENTQNFSNIISESNNSITLFLWISYVTIVVWALAYLFIH